MRRFDYMQFTGGSVDEFVVHAKKYTKEQAIELLISEGVRSVDYAVTIDDVIERWCRYYVRVPDFCGYDGEGGCYSYCGKEERGAFPVWVIELN